MFCQQCGHENLSEANFCKQCGASLNIEIQNESIVYASSHEKKLLEAFINKPDKVLYYEKAFNTFDIENRKWYWSWWGAFLTMAFLFYRKIFFPAIILTVITVVINIIALFNPSNVYLSILPLLLSILFFIFLGGFSTRFIYNHFKKIKNDISIRIINQDEQINEMRRQGGFIKIWVLIVGYSLFTAVYMGGIYFYTINKNNSPMLEKSLNEKTETEFAKSEQSAEHQTMNADESIYKSGEIIADALNRSMSDEDDSFDGANYERSFVTIDGKNHKILNVTANYFHRASGQIVYVSYILYLRFDNQNNLFGYIENCEQIPTLNGRMFIVDNNATLREVQYVNGIIQQIE